jgi:uncharacterized protein
MLACEHDDNRGRWVEEAELIAAEIAKLLDGGTYVSRESGGTQSIADPRRHPRRRALQRPGPLPAREAPGRRPRGDRGQVPGPGGARRPLLDDELERRRRLARHVVPLLTQLPERRGLVSRAQALAVVVCSPKLLSARCSTVEDMRLMNVLCRFGQTAQIYCKSPTAPRARPTGDV